MKIKPNYCPPGPQSLGLFPTGTTIPRTIPHQDNSLLGPLPRNKATHQDQYLYGGELSWWGVVRIRMGGGGGGAWMLWTFYSVNPFSTGTGWTLYKIYGGFRISCKLILRTLFKFRNVKVRSPSTKWAISSSTYWARGSNPGTQGTDTTKPRTASNPGAVRAARWVEWPVAWHLLRCRSQYVISSNLACCQGTGSRCSKM